MNIKHQSDDTDEAFALLEFEGDALEPDRLAPIIPLPASCSRKKGDKIGRTHNGKTPIARTGYYSVSTAGKDLPAYADAHLSFIIDALVGRLTDIKRLVVEQSLTWHILFFEGSQKGSHFLDLSPTLCQRVAELGIVLKRKEHDRFTTVIDPAWIT